jgi:hypothetical protein
MPVDGGREALLSYLVDPVFQSNVRGTRIARAGLVLFKNFPSSTI